MESEFIISVACPEIQNSGDQKDSCLKHRLDWGSIRGWGSHLLIIGHLSVVKLPFCTRVRQDPFRQTQVRQEGDPKRQTQIRW